MERFIATVTDTDLRGRLVTAIDGKGAFRRFKDVLMSFPADRERWFVFRTERLRACMDAWLEAHNIEAVARPVWSPPASEVSEEIAEEDDAVATLRRARLGVEGERRRLRELVDAVALKDVDTAIAFLEFLRDRRGRGEGRGEEARRRRRRRHWQGQEEGARARGRGPAGGRREGGGGGGGGGRGGGGGEEARRQGRQGRRQEGRR
jgi:uncharacterized membrane protein YgcG